jgi:L-alanine-DL-glutamate epimerase-like enolase superfamily enzyme
MAAFGAKAPSGGSRLVGRVARLANPILQQPYEVKDGKLHIPDVQGIGLEWDEKAVAVHMADDF